MEPTDQEYWYTGGLLHEARMKECYGDWYPSWRAVWPENVKEFRRQRHAGQPWIDVACAQVRALRTLKS